MFSKDNALRAGVVVAGILVIAFFWFLFHTMWNTFVHGASRFLVGSQAALAVILVGVIVAGAAFYLNDTYERLSISLFIGGALLVIAGFIGGGALSSYWNTHSLYEASKTTVAVDGDNQSFKSRVPYEVAVGTSGANLGDNTGDVTGKVKSIPGSGQYTTSVIRRGWFKGYEATQVLSLPEYGQPNISNDVKFCKFNEDKAPYRLGGSWWSNNLTYRILNAAGGWTTWFENEDVSVVCNEKGEPVLYAPIVKSEIGFLSSHDVPAGVVTYNGATGEIQYHKEMSSVNGVSLYPASLAAKQREATHTANGFADYVFNRAGWEDTSKDEDDPNSENPTEFGMVTTGGVIQYVTPLTPRGESKSIVAISTVNAGDNKYGQLAQLNVHKYKTARQATSTVKSNVMANGLGGQKTNLDVFEVVPSQNGEWTATIGQRQTVVYRATIAGDDSITLLDSSGKTVFTNRANDSNTTDQSKSGEAKDSGDASKSDAGRDLSSMSVDELKQLSDDVTKELSDRAKAKPDGK